MGKGGGGRGGSGEAGGGKSADRGRSLGSNRKIDVDQIDSVMA